jgi:hypothetical protein
LITFFKNDFELALFPYEKIGIALFGWLTATYFWSDADGLTHLEKLLMYRQFFIVPFLSIVVWKLVNIELAATVGLGAGILNIVLSWLHAYGLIDWDAPGYGSMSLSGHFVHGLSVSMVLAICILGMYKTSLLSVRVTLGLTIVLGIIHVFAIEDGRTAYGQVLIVALVGIFVFLSGRVLLLSLAALIGFCVVMFFAVDQFSWGIQEAFNQVADAVLKGRFEGSVGARLQALMAPLYMGLFDLLFGYGPGSIRDEVSALHSLGVLSKQISNGNLHNDFVQFVYSGGLIACLLYVSFVIAFFYEGVKGLKFSAKPLVFVVMSLGLGLVWTSMFTSSLWDIRERHLVILMFVFSSVLIRKMHRDNSSASKLEGMR